MTEIKAKLNKLDIAPRKVRSIIRIISNLPIGEAEAQLLFRKERAAKPILKLLRSAVANAKNKGIAIDNLYIKTIFANQGKVLKRWLPRARGMATPLHKKSSHVTILLAPGVKKSRFTMMENISSKKTSNVRQNKLIKGVKKNQPSNRSISSADKGIIKDKKEIKVEKASGADKKDSPIKKMFRRKSI